MSEVEEEYATPPEKFVDDASSKYPSALEAVGEAGTFVQAAVMKLPLELIIGFAVGEVGSAKVENDAFGPLVLEKIL